jgi:putative ABC transport system permease protein
MFHLALRNLVQNRTRLMVSTGGVALALTLILALDAILVGAERQTTAYIDHSGADVIVSQQGVRTMHMSASALPLAVVDGIAAVPGVAAAMPLRFISNNVTIGEQQSLVYVIGLPPDARMGRPWDIVEGVELPGRDQVIVDRSVAAAAGAGIGDTATIIGRPFEIAGLSEGTVGFTNSIVFITLDDFTRLGSNSGTVSYVIVKTRPGEPPSAVAKRIEASVVGVTAQTRDQFSRQERRLVKDMSTDLVGIMNLAGFLIGLAVMALTVYTATLSRRAEYGVLKALGARNHNLYLMVVAQAVYSVALAFATGLLVTLLLARVVPAFSPNLSLQVSSASLVRVAFVALVIAGLSALLPIRQIAGLDPAMVYRGGGRR